MKDSGVKDTAAYRVVAQIMSHTWPDEDALEDGEFLSICRIFNQSGGLWESVMDGDPATVTTLEQSVDVVVQTRRLSKMACRITGLRYGTSGAHLTC
jgi:hypothetical protein